MLVGLGSARVFAACWPLVPDRRQPPEVVAAASGCWLAAGLVMLLWTASIGKQLARARSMAPYRQRVPRPDRAGIARQCRGGQCVTRRLLV